MGIEVLHERQRELLAELHAIEERERGLAQDAAVLRGRLDELTRALAEIAADQSQQSAPAAAGRAKRRNIPELVRRFVEESGQKWPTVDQIVEALGVRRRGVEAAVKKLQEKNLVVLEGDLVVSADQVKAAAKPPLAEAADD